MPYADRGILHSNLETKLANTSTMNNNQAARIFYSGAYTLLKSRQTHPPNCIMASKAAHHLLSKVCNPQHLSHSAVRSLTCVADNQFAVNRKPNSTAKTIQGQPRNTRQHSTATIIACNALLSWPETANCNTHSSSNMTYQFKEFAGKPDEKNRKPNSTSNSVGV